jgi:uncharacterized protein YecE (DUF72 family)
VILLGTSGFSYDDWVGTVYPAGLRRDQWLPYYATEFNTVELNVTYYRVPSPRTVEGWVRRTPEGFVFSVKANSGLTHDREDPDFEGFRKGIAPLIEAGRLACVLAQFPYSFHPSDASRGYLLRVREGMGELPVVVEFRDSAWATDDTFGLLEELHFGYCCVDEPRLKGLMPPIARATGPVAYVRFHGRNAAQWWDHEQAYQRYDYTYRDDELREWVDKIRDLDRQAEITLVYANNHYRGQSVDTIRKLQQLLAGDQE